MSDLTLEEKTEAAEHRAREKAAELHFFDQGQPHYPLGFSIHYRNPGHWDVAASETPGRASAWLAANPGGRTNGRDGSTERAFRIRGEPGAVVVFDERWNPHKPHPRESMEFRSVSAAMAWIVEELMQEPMPKGRDVALAAADALKLFNGHDSNANLKARFGDKWWDHIGRIESDLRATATGLR